MVARVTSEKPVSESRKRREASRAKLKWPKTLGGCVDALYDLQQKRRGFTRLEAEVKELEIALKAHMRKVFTNDKIRGAKGAMASADLEPQEVAIVENWDKFYAYVAKTKAFELLHKRISSTAMKERWEAKKSVPGVKRELFNEIVLRVLPKRKQLRK